MTRDAPRDKRDEEILDENAERESTPSEGDSFEPASGGASSEEELVAESDSDAVDEFVNDGDLDVAVPADLTPDIAASEPEVEEPAAESPALATSPEASAALPADSPGGQDSSASAEPPGEGPKAATKPDWSNFVPAPGYADPETGRPIFRYGTVDPIGFEFRELVFGRRPVFEPETVEGGVEPPGPPPFLAGATGGDAATPIVLSQSAGGPAPAVSVAVRVSFTDEALAHLSREPLRQAAEFSRGELMVVAQKLYELDKDIRRRVQQERIQAGLY